MTRFKVVDIDEARKYDDPEELAGDWIEDHDDTYYSRFLVDTLEKKVVFSDSTEPEDATLDRSFAPLVDLLNEVTS